MEPDSRRDLEVTEAIPSEDTPTGWFKMGCSLASKGRPAEAEKALKIAADMQEEYPIA